MSATVQAKFRCTTLSLKASPYGAPNTTPGGFVALTPVSGPGNEDWSKYTPSGSLEMQIDNQPALAQFEIGQDYLVEIKRAP